jgi:hypothetical protein
MPSPNIEMGILATNPALENASPPGVANSSRYGFSTPGTVREVADSLRVATPTGRGAGGRAERAERPFARMLG